MKHKLKYINLLKPNGVLEKPFLRTYNHKFVMRSLSGFASLLLKSVFRGITSGNLKDILIVHKCNQYNVCIFNDSSCVRLHNNE